MTEYVRGDVFMPNRNMTPKELEELWKAWSTMEQKKRFASSNLDIANDQGGVWIIYS